MAGSAGGAEPDAAAGSSAGTSAAGGGALIVALKASCVPPSPHSTANRPSRRRPIHATATISAPATTSGSVHTELAMISPPTSSRVTPITDSRTRGRMSHA